MTQARAARKSAKQQKPQIVKAASRLEITQHEIDLLQMYADGKSTDEIAEDLEVNKQTIHNRNRMVYVKLDVAGIVPAIAEAFRRGMIE